jgi:2-oxoisovalerate dehydrogenase E1 component alpha subunit
MSAHQHSAPANASVDPPDLLLTGAIQYVTADGELTELGRRAEIRVTDAQALHRDMVLARRLDTEALALQRQGELNLWLMSWGQEAAQVGSVRALRDTDMVFPSYREHAAALCRGLSPRELLTQWRGASHAGWDSLAHNFHIYSLVLGTQTLHATGYAEGVVMDGSDEVVAVYFGDGATSQGDVNEAFNWAAAGRLPVLFICQNNQWAISTPTTLQMRTAIHQRAQGFGLQAYHVDGNDVLAMHGVTTEAAAYVRAGYGPALVEATTYRRGGHSSSDDPGRYRPKAELEYWELRDPITRLERLLVRLGTAPSWFADLQEEADEFAVKVREACRAIEEPDLDNVFRDAYASDHPLVAAERTAHADLRALLDAES